MTRGLEIFFSPGQFFTGVTVDLLRGVPSGVGRSEMGVSNGWNCITVARLFTYSEQIAVRTQKPALNLLILIRSAAKCPPTHDCQFLIALQSLCIAAISRSGLKQATSGCNADDGLCEQLDAGRRHSGR